MLNKKNKFLKFQNRNFSINSKKVKKNDIFFAIEGSKQSGNLYSSEEYFDSKEISEFTQLNKTFQDAFKSAADAKLDVSATESLRLSTKNTLTFNIKVNAGVTPVPTAM